MATEEQDIKKGIVVYVLEEAVVLPGKPLTYDDLTPEQIEELQRPAKEATTSANEAAANANKAAQTAVTSSETANSAASRANSAAQSAIAAASSANTSASLAETAKNEANTAAQNAKDATEKANTAITNIKALGTELENKESERNIAEASRKEAETKRVEAETSRESQFSQMKTTVDELVEKTTEAKDDATKAATSANTAAEKANTATTSANNAATSANNAAASANQAAQNVNGRVTALEGKASQTYKNLSAIQASGETNSDKIYIDGETAQPYIYKGGKFVPFKDSRNGYYSDFFTISRDSIKVKHLRYIGFSDIANDEWCYLLNQNRVVKFNLKTLEVVYEVKATTQVGDNTWGINSCEFVRVVGDYIYVYVGLLSERDTGFYVSKLRESDGKFISEVFVPIKFYTAYNNASVYYGECLINEEYVISYDGITKKIVKYYFQSEIKEELTEEIVSPYSMNYHVNFIKDIDGVIKRALIVTSPTMTYIATEDGIRTIDTSGISIYEWLLYYNINLTVSSLSASIQNSLCTISISKKDDNNFTADSVSTRITSGRQVFEWLDKCSNSVTNFPIRFSKMYSSIGIYYLYMPRVTNPYSFIFASNISNVFLKANYILGYSNGFSEITIENYSKDL